MEIANQCIYQAWLLTTLVLYFYRFQLFYCCRTSHPWVILFHNTSISTNNEGGKSVDPVDILLKLTWIGVTPSLILLFNSMKEENELIQFHRLLSVNDSPVIIQLTARVGPLWKCQGGDERYIYKIFIVWSLPDYFRPRNRHEDILKMTVTVWC